MIQKATNIEIRKKIAKMLNSRREVGPEVYFFREVMSRSSLFFGQKSKLTLESNLTFRLTLVFNLTFRNGALLPKISKLPA